MHYKNLSLKSIKGEKWKPIKGFEKLYSISSFGRIKSHEKMRYYKLTDSYQVFQEKIIPPKIVSNGYLGVKLFNNGLKKQFLIHRLVCAHYLKNGLNMPQVNHIDGNKKNNDITNLEWCTPSQNKLHSLYILKNCKSTRKVIDINTDKVYTSIMKAKKDLNITYAAPHISMMLRGLVKNNTSLIFYDK